MAVTEYLTEKLAHGLGKDAVCPGRGSGAAGLGSGWSRCICSHEAEGGLEEGTLTPKSHQKRLTSSREAPTPKDSTTFPKCNTKNQGSSSDR